MLTVGSLFAGVGGLELGLERTGGFKTVWQVEIDKNANAVRAVHWPDTPRYEDVTKFTIESDPVRPDLICGGFPCQDISVAGKRAGLAGSRSGLFREFMRIVSERSPRWVLVENVPGLLSSNDGRDMRTVLSKMAELGYGTAYRILDAQWFGVAQRRRRVFIVGCFGDWRRAAEVLFESESLPWNPPPSREKWQGFTHDVTQSLTTPGRGVSRAGDSRGQDPMIACGLTARYGKGVDSDCTDCVIPIHNTDIGTLDRDRDGAGVGNPADPMFTIGTRARDAIAYRTSGNLGVMEQGDKTASLNTATDPNQNIVMETQSVRRLTPCECERLQGFPDDWTQLGADDQEISDSARYRMLGNAVAVPVAQWIGERILETERKSNQGDPTR